MLFAITDIETTGGFASSNSITEIAVCLHDGQKILSEWQSLVQPDKSIPPYITTLTGIDDKMVESAPKFDEIAEELADFIGDAVFVAHNVNFDYSFLKRQYDDLGLEWNKKRLCTVRLSRKAFPGLNSYSLSNLCRSLDIHNEAAHRAQGDARSTAQLFSLILKSGGPSLLEDALQRGSGEAFLPNHIEQKQYAQLPEQTGVYYFHDAKGKIIYLGKALNIKKRVKQHFTGKMKSERRQAFLKEIHSFSFQLSGNELLALLIEDRDIKEHWPRHNKAQKFKSGRFGVYTYGDQRGFMRLCINKASLSHPPIQTFSSAFRARQWMFTFCEQFAIHPKYCGLHFVDEPEESKQNHNEKVEIALREQNKLFGSFLIKGKGRSAEECSLIWIEHGRFKALGYVERNLAIQNHEDLTNLLDSVPFSSTAESIIASFLDKIKKENILALGGEVV